MYDASFLTLGEGYAGGHYIISVLVCVGHISLKKIINARVILFTIPQIHEGL